MKKISGLFLRKGGGGEILNLNPFKIIDGNKKDVKKYFSSPADSLLNFSTTKITTNRAIIEEHLIQNINMQYIHDPGGNGTVAHRGTTVADGTGSRTKAAGSCAS